MQSLKHIFNILLLLLIIISLYPGSLLGYLFLNDINKQPNLISNPFGTSINHFIFYFYISLLGLFIHIKSEHFNKLVFSLFFLSTILEIFQYIIPNRSFEFVDLLANILGVIVAYLIIKIYLLLNKQ